MFEDRLKTSEQIDEKVKQYICSHYAFTPSCVYEPVKVAEEKVMPYKELEDVIVKRMQMWVSRIMKEDTKSEYK